jgi:hypothetical protein
MSIGSRTREPARQRVLRSHLPEARSGPLVARDAPELAHGWDTGIQRSRAGMRRPACDVAQVTPYRQGPRACFCIESAARYMRMFTARAATRSTVAAERVDSAAIKALAWRVSGMASVGLNAVAFVSET